MEHVTQAFQYEILLNQHRPNLDFETYTIGRQFKSDVLAAKKRLEDAKLYIWGFDEVLQRARARFERILKILNI